MAGVFTEAPRELVPRKLRVHTKEKHMDDEPWLPLYEWPDSFGSWRCCALAVCAELGLMVTCKEPATLEIWSLASLMGDQGTKAVPCCMDLDGDILSLAFFNPPNSGTGMPLLLVSNYFGNAVHILDVVSRTQLGHLAPPGTILSPRGVAAAVGVRQPCSCVAVSQCGQAVSAVSLYEWSADTNDWGVLRVIGVGTLYSPRGLRFSACGTMLCVADTYRNCLRLFRASDGQLVKSLPTSDYPMDLEEVEGGWMVGGCGHRALELVQCTGPESRRTLVLSAEYSSATALATALAVVPGFGVAVNHWDAVAVYASASVAAMTKMAPCRVAWMVVTARAMV